MAGSDLSAAAAAMPEQVRRRLQRGVAIPAHPLALNEHRKLDERRQRALSRYYLDAGVGGLAVGVHTTQFEIRDPEVGLFETVLALAKEEIDRAEAAGTTSRVVRVAGICGETAQATAEAELARSLGYHAGLLSMKAMGEASEDALLRHAARVGEALPLIGFYLQPAVGGRLFSQGFWRRFFEIPSVVAVKIAPFHRYATLDVMRALAESGRTDVAAYTGNDDNIVADLLTPFAFDVNGERVERRIVGGLLGHWSVWTRRAVELLDRCHAAVRENRVDGDLLRLANEVTDSNAAFFDAANRFHGVIAGIHEVLRRQGLLEGTWCLDPAETLGPGQKREIDRVYAAYPHLHDDAFIAEHRDRWLGG